MPCLKYIRCLKVIIGYILWIVNFFVFLELRLYVKIDMLARHGSIKIFLLDFMYHMSKTIISSIDKLGAYKDSFVAENGLMVNTIKNKWLQPYKKTNGTMSCWQTKTLTLLRTIKGFLYLTIFLSCWPHV